MHIKPKFKPDIIRIKLNPEQAVLICECFIEGRKYVGTGGAPEFLTICTAIVNGSKSYFPYGMHGEWPLYTSNAASS